MPSPRIEALLIDRITPRRTRRDMVESVKAPQQARLLIDGRWCDGVDTFAVLDKYSGAVVGSGQRASREQVDAAVAAARRSFESQPLDAYARYRILMKAAEL